MGNGYVVLGKIPKKNREILDFIFFCLATAGEFFIGISLVSLLMETIQDISFGRINVWGGITKILIEIPNFSYLKLCIFLQLISSVIALQKKTDIKISCYISFFLMSIIEVLVAFICLIFLYDIYIWFSDKQEFFSPNWVTWDYFKEIFYPVGIFLVLFGVLDWYRKISIRLIYVTDRTELKSKIFDESNDGKGYDKQEDSTYKNEKITGKEWCLFFQDG